MGFQNDEKSERLDFPLRTRVDKRSFDRLEKLLVSSTCQSMGELIRKLINREKINCVYTDTTMNAPMEELVSIRKELKAIGVNINQITRSFNQEKTREAARQYYVMQVADLYKKVDIKVDRLLLMVGELTEKWLQKL